LQTNSHQRLRRDEDQVRKNKRQAEFRVKRARILHEGENVQAFLLSDQDLKESLVRLKVRNLNIMKYMNTFYDIFLKSDVVEICMDGLVKIRKLTCSPDPPFFTLIESGLIPTLCKQLRSGDHKVKMEAAWF